ncbi:hypothetical protein BG011_005777 [Mortierella polycephala]|uniref:Transmembrane protein 198 n=1 Tax=Mortierella polycephala TaxID=41804 RepID=A0A9P6U0W3_9FUNG|nr:hypothetical protein BG011_005777 [Mortierella polycephala]
MSRSYMALAVWVIYCLYISQPSSAIPLPLDDVYTPLNGSLFDPFSTPDYFANSTFTWEQGFYGVLYVFFGGVEVLHGYKYIRVTLLVAGFLIWSSTAVMIMIITNTNTGKYLSSGIYFLIWVSVGLVGSVVSFFLWHLGIVLTGAYGTFVVVAVIFSAANMTNFILRYILLAIFVIIGGYLTKRYERVAVILATSVGGAYCMMFGLDMFIQTGFRGTYHVMLSQSTANFHPVPGTWVMVACVPAIAIFGIIWELKHHEEPVGSWFFGDGAKPLPPLPGEKPRRCCGFTLSRSAKAVKSNLTDPANSSEITKPFGSGSEETLVPPTKRGGLFAYCLPLCGKREKPVKTDETNMEAAEMDATPMSVVENTTTTAIAMVPTQTEDDTAMEKDKDKSKGSLDHLLPSRYGEGHETIGHTGVHKVVIQHEVREFGVDVDERW